MYALSVRKRNRPRLQLNLLFNLADLQYGVSFSCTPSKAKPKQSSITFHTQLEITLFSEIVFTLPNVLVTIQKYL